MTRIAITVIITYTFGCITAKEEQYPLDSILEQELVKAGAWQQAPKLVEPPPTPPPQGRAEDVGFGYTIYRRGYHEETLVTPYGGHVALSPPGMPCKKPPANDCHFKHFTVQGNMLYLILSGHVIAVREPRDFREIEFSEYQDSTFQVFTSNKEAGIVWINQKRKDTKKMPVYDKRVAGILVFKGQWTILPVTTPAPTLLKRLNPEDISELRQVTHTNFAIVLKKGTVLPVTTRQTPTVVSSMP